MDFTVRLGATPQPHWRCGKELQRRVAVKDAISCGRICEMAYLAAAALLFCSATPAAEPGDPLARMAWLAGCWAADSSESGSGEQWMAPAGGTMLGMSRAVKGGRTAEFEFMQIRTGDDGRLVFIAMPAGRSPTPFAQQRLAEREVVFENKAHDFPQRVIYRLDAEGVLRARIEGQYEGKPAAVDFPLRRVGCAQGVAR
jgi:Domain of unknown function (DUF6265)